MEFKIRGPLPEEAAHKFLFAMSDTHISGLINHCVEKLVWQRTALGFLAGVGAGYLFSKYLIH